VKKTLSHLALTTLLVLAVTLLSGSAFAANTSFTSDLKDVVKWGVWHEGCRIYSADNSLGDPEQIRECLVTVYAQNVAIQQQLRHASKGSILSAVRSAASEIPSERQFDRFVEFACKNGLLTKFKQMTDVSDFDGVRALYYSTFRSHEEIRNLLAAVSDKQLGEVVREIEFGERVRQVNQGVYVKQEIPSAD